MGRLAAVLPVVPMSVMVFVSFAKGQTDAQSDIDVVIVRPSATEEDDELCGTIFVS